MPRTKSQFLTLSSNLDYHAQYLACLIHLNHNLPNELSYDYVFYLDYLEQWL